jgi:hypothetical protein
MCLASKANDNGMKTFFFMGVNPRNKTGVSWKVWKIERKGRIVVRRWGPALLVKRQVFPAQTLQEKKMVFPSAEAAICFERAIITEKKRAGYERRPRTRRRAT